MGAAIDRFPVLIENQHPFGHFRIVDIEFRFVQAMTSRRTAGRRCGRRSHRLWIQMNDHPPQIAFTQNIVGPHNWSNGFRTATKAGDDALPDIRIESFRTVFRIVESGDRESHGHGQTDTIVANRFLQDDKAAGVFLFIRNDASKRDFTTECVQRFLRIKDWSFDTEHFKLLQIAAAGIADTNQCRRP